jgi:hypothetical protein
MTQQGRYSRLPDPVRPEDTVEVTSVDDGEDERLADQQATWRMLLYAVDDA